MKRNYETQLAKINQLTDEELAQAAGLPGIAKKLPQILGKQLPAETRRTENRQYNDIERSAKILEAMGNHRAAGGLRRIQERRGKRD